MTRPLRIMAAIAALPVLLVAPGAWAQMYTNGPGLYMSLEGRYLQNSGDATKLSPSADTDKTSNSFSDRNLDDKGWGGKAALDYRFQNNWDISISGSGLKNIR